MVLLPPLRFVQQPKRWLKAISSVRATTSGGPTFAYEACVSRYPSEELEQIDLESWRVAFVGAEPVNARVLRAFAEKFSRAGFRPSSFLPCYGLAEATLMVAGGPSGLRVLRQDDGIEHYQSDTVPREFVSCGTPIAGHELLVVEPDTGQRRAEGEVGEIWVRGPSIATGFRDDASETECTFRASPANTRAGPYLRTGDLGFMHDGEIYITGRMKDLIIIRGQNMYPQDVEQTAGGTDRSLGFATAAFSISIDGREELIVVQECADCDMEECAVRKQEILDLVMAEHGVRCYDVVLVRRNTIPRTSSGKIMRWSCRQMYVVRALEKRRIQDVACPSNLASLASGEVANEV